MYIKRLVPLLACLALVVLLLPSISPAYAVSDTPTVIDADDGGDTGSSGNKGMFETTAALGKALVSGIWSLFGIYVPGFSFTFGQMWLGVALASISILVVKLIFGFGGGGPRGIAPRTGSTSRPKISRERRNDEF